MNIKSIRAIEILDSRGNPTIKAYVLLENGIEGSASVPSGASTGKYEASELRDGGARLKGKGVLRAVANINTEISQALSGMNVENQALIDEALIRLDGTADKSRLGANAILAVSLAVLKSAAELNKAPVYKYINQMTSFKMKIPTPLVNVINGGAHANWVADIQEYMIIPIGFDSFHKSIMACSEIYMCLKEILKTGGHFISVGDEGGFTPLVSDNKHPLILMANAVSQAGYILGKDFIFGIDAAASEFYLNGKYQFKREKREMSVNELADFYKQIVEQNGVVSIEDPFAEDDWENFVSITADMKDRVQIVGDDLYVTNPIKIKKGIEQKATNAVLIKLNQIGTLSETLKAVAMARAGGQSIIISHRSGETEDTFIADLAVAVGAEEIKTGAPARGERTAKYNRLLEIENNAKLQSF